MRLGLDLRAVDDAQRRARAVEADQLGLWAVLVNTIVHAAELATVTEHVHLAVAADARAVHPHTIAEEVAVLDHLSHRRALAVVSGSNMQVRQVRSMLAGEIVDGVALTPPPAQTAVPVWDADQLAIAELTGDLDDDRTTVDDHRDAGTTHLFVTWPGTTLALARHLASRAVGPDFPQIVAAQADIVAPE